MRTLTLNEFLLETSSEISNGSQGTNDFRIKPTLNNFPERTPGLKTSAMWGARSAAAANTATHINNSRC